MTTGAIRRESIVVEQEIFIPGASVRLFDFEWEEPPEGVVGSVDKFCVDLALTPRVKHARGSYIDRWNGSRYEHLGELYAVPPGFRLHAQGAKGRQRSLVYEIDIQHLTQCEIEEEIWTDRALSAYLNIKSSALRQYSYYLSEELRAPGFAGPMLIEGLSVAIAVELMRYGRRLMETPQLRKGGLAPWRLRLIEERVQSFETSPSLSELAELCGITVRHLMRAFHQETGQTIGAYVEAVRLDRAKALLTEGDMPIKRIAEILGFSSPASFSFAFRRASGCTPRAFRHDVLNARSRGVVCVFQSK